MARFSLKLLNWTSFTTTVVCGGCVWRSGCYLCRPCTRLSPGLSRIVSQETDLLILISRSMQTRRHSISGDCWNLHHNNVDKAGQAGGLLISPKSSGSGCPGPPVKPIAPISSSLTSCRHVDQTGANIDRNGTANQNTRGGNLRKSSESFSSAVGWNVFKC